MSTRPTEARWNTPPTKYYIVAPGGGEPTAEWYFPDTRAVELVGVHHLSLIVGAPGPIEAKPRSRCMPRSGAESAASSSTTRNSHPDTAKS